MPFALLALTEDLLHKIAAIVGAPDVVVACCHHQSRDAVRRGVDEAERRRFGLGRTVREAEGLLRGDFSLSRDAYSTRYGAARTRDGSDLGRTSDQQTTSDRATSEDLGHPRLKGPRASTPQNIRVAPRGGAATHS